MQKYKRLKYAFLLMSICFFSLAKAEDQNYSNYLSKLHQVYPKSIISFSNDSIVFKNGNKLFVTKNTNERTFSDKFHDPSFLDQLEQPAYQSGDTGLLPRTDPGRIRYIPFFMNMYGQNQNEVKKNLTHIYWMPGVFGKKYLLPVTTINGVNMHLQHISDQLETLVRMNPEYKKYLEKPDGTFNWRVVANSKQLSMHSFGISIDLNVKYANYWQWELQKNHEVISESAPLTYKNQIPFAIVDIFEKNGFIWGGKWYHFDTMHFEYRPELFN